jgi:prepilin-type N-terminal cleavage/methylation domain-containing protein
MKIKNKSNNRKGFTLIETLITMSVFLIVLSGVYMMVVHYGDVSRTEHSRLRMQQESRFLLSNFASEVKSAGAVLTITFTGWFLEGKEPYFNGIYPLNKTNYPDGIILASGDPEAVTRTTSAYSPGTHGPVIPVEDTTVPAYDDTRPYEYRPWSPGDIGIIVSHEGYLVFKVELVSQTTIQMRGQAVYYSGLLNTTASAFKGIGYDDPAVINGNLIEYPKHAPVVRLSSFSIYMFKEVAHNIDDITDRVVRQFIRVSDCFGLEDALSDGSDVVKSVISENIWDLQIAYKAYGAFRSATPDTPIEDGHHYFAGGTTSQNVNDLLDDLRRRNLKQLDFDTISITDEYGGRGAHDERLVPAIGDQGAYNLPAGKYNYKILSFTLEPKNYNIIFAL